MEQTTVALVGLAIDLRFGKQVSIAEDSKYVETAPIYLGRSVAQVGLEVQLDLLHLLADVAQLTP